MFHLCTIAHADDNLICTQTGWKTSRTIVYMLREIDYISHSMLLNEFRRLVNGFQEEIGEKNKLPALCCCVCRRCLQSVRRKFIVAPQIQQYIEFPYIKKSRRMILSEMKFKVSFSKGRFIHMRIGGYHLSMFVPQTLK